MNLRKHFLFAVLLSLGSGVGVTKGAWASEMDTRCNSVSRLGERSPQVKLKQSKKKSIVDTTIPSRNGAYGVTILDSAPIMTLLQPVNTVLEHNKNPATPVQDGVNVVSHLKILYDGSSSIVGAVNRGLQDEKEAGRSLDASDSGSGGFHLIAIDSAG